MIYVLLWLALCATCWTAFFTVLAFHAKRMADATERSAQLAAEVNWLFDHVRWEPEEDLARLIGDAPAHTVAQTTRKCLDALRSFVKTNFAHKVTPA